MDISTKGCEDIWTTRQYQTYGAQSTTSAADGPSSKSKSSNSNV